MAALAAVEADPEMRAEYERIASQTAIIGGRA